MSIITSLLFVPVLHWNVTWVCQQKFLCVCDRGSAAVSSSVSLIAARVGTPSVDELPFSCIHRSRLSSISPSSFQDILLDLESDFQLQNQKNPEKCVIKHAGNQAKWFKLSKKIEATGGGNRLASTMILVMPQYHCDPFLPWHGLVWSSRRHQCTWIIKRASFILRPVNPVSWRAHNWAKASWQHCSTLLLSDLRYTDWRKGFTRSTHCSEESEEHEYMQDTGIQDDQCNDGHDQSWKMWTTLDSSLQFLFCRRLASETVSLADRFPPQTAACGQEYANLFHTFKLSIGCPLNWGCPPCWCTATTSAMLLQQHMVVEPINAPIRSLSPDNQQRQEMQLTTSAS